MVGERVELSNKIFLIVINPRSALKSPNYIYICNCDKFKSFMSEKKMTTLVCHFFSPREGLKLLKLVSNNICFFNGFSFLRVQFQFFKFKFCVHHFTVCAE